MKLKLYEIAFENYNGEYLDIKLYPEENWLELIIDGKFAIGSIEEWDEIDKEIRKFLEND